MYFLFLAELWSVGHDVLIFLIMSHVVCVSGEHSVLVSTSVSQEYCVIRSYARHTFFLFGYSE